VQPYLDRLANPRPALDASVKVMHGRVAEEFDGRVWFAPSGATVGWAPPVPFGRKTGQSPPLIGSGRYPAAWQGVGPGAITRVTADSATIGVSGSVFPFAGVIRGGTGANPSTSPTFIRPKKLTAGKRRWTGPQRFAMWWALYFAYGVTLSEATMLQGVRVPGRPHATWHPELERRIVRTFRNYVVRGDATPVLLAA
jgi:hypothetical protein